MSDRTSKFPIVPTITVYLTCIPATPTGSQVSQLRIRSNTVGKSLIIPTAAFPLTFIPAPPIRASLAGLPAELHIALFQTISEPSSLAALSVTCKSLHAVHEDLHPGRVSLSTPRWLSLESNETEILGSLLKTWMPPNYVFCNTQCKYVPRPCEHEDICRCAICDSVPDEGEDRKAPCAVCPATKEMSRLSI